MRCNQVGRAASSIHSWAGLNWSCFSVILHWLLFLGVFGAEAKVVTLSFSKNRYKQCLPFCKDQNVFIVCCFSEPPIVNTVSEMQQFWAYVYKRVHTHTHTEMCSDIYLVTDWLIDWFSICMNERMASNNSGFTENIYFVKWQCSVNVISFSWQLPLLLQAVKLGA